MTTAGDLKQLSDQELFPDVGPALAELTELALHSPTAAASASAVHVLRAMQRFGFDSAATALGELVSTALIEEARRGGVRALSPTSELSATLLGESYTAGCLLRDFPKRLTVVDATGAVFDPAILEAFQCLTERESPLAPEILRAFVVRAAMNHQLFLAAVTGNPSTAAMTRAVKQAMAEAAIVPGSGQCDTDFQVGRDLLVKLTPSGLRSVLDHELGHYRADESSRASYYTSMMVDDELLKSVSDATTKLSSDVLTGDEEEVHWYPERLPLSLMFALSSTGAPRYWHASLLVAGLPIPLDLAVPAALAIVRALGAKPAAAALSHSPLGVFHVYVPAEAIGTPDLADTSTGAADAWYRQLAAERRVLPMPDLLPALVGDSDPGAHVFATDRHRSWTDWDILRRATEGQLDASDFGVVRIVEAFIGQAEAQGVRLLSPHGDGLTPLAHNVGQSLFVLVHDRDWVSSVPTVDAIVDTLAVLAALGADLNTPSPGDSRTLLTRAAGELPPRLVARLLELGLNPDGPDGTGRRPLLWAARGGRTETVRLLLTAGPEPNATAPDGRSAMHEAAAAQDGESVLALLEAGADVDAAALDGTTPLMLAREPRIVRDLVGQGADPAARRLGGATALMDAASYGRVDTVDALLSAGADADDADSKGWTPLRWAVEGSARDWDPALVDHLIDAGAIVDDASDEGTTPLMAAATNQNTRAVEALLRRGADVRLTRDDGSSASTDANDPGIIELLRAVAAGTSGTGPDPAENGEP